MTKDMKNTDTHLFLEDESDPMSPSCHMTESRALGINAGGSVWVAPLRVWHSAMIRAEKLEGALKKIASNTCCDRCQEAALVAKSVGGEMTDDKGAGEGPYLADELGDSFAVFGPTIPDGTHPDNWLCVGSRKKCAGMSRLLNAAYASGRASRDGLREASQWALEFFKSRDEMNAKVHCSPIRLSPITERFIRALEADGEGK